MASEQQLCLTWYNHQTTLVDIFNKLLSNEILVDCTLAAEGQYLKAHKVNLSACSPYFELLLSQHYDKHPIIILKDVNFRELEALVNYVYQGKLNVSPDNLDALLEVAKNLQLKGLSDSGASGRKPKEKPPEKRQLPLPTIPSAQQRIPIISPSGLTIEHQRSNQLDHSQGSTNVLDGSPVPRKRRRTRRRPGDNRSSLGHTALESHQDSYARDSSPLNTPQNVAWTPVSKPVAVIPDQPPVLDRTDHHIIPEPAQPKHQDIVHETEPNTEMLLKPKQEYPNEDVIEECVQDLALDDDVNDLNQSQAGPSNEGSSCQGFTLWHMASDRSTDEVCMQAQKAVDAQPDSQKILDPEEKMYSNHDDAVSITSQETLIYINHANEPDDTSILDPNPEDTNSDRNDAIGISSQQMLILRNVIEEPSAPLVKDCRIHLQRCDDVIVAESTSAKKQILMRGPSSHLNTSNGGEKTETIFQCAHCPKSFKRKKYLRRHLKFSSCKTEIVECGQCSQQFSTKSSLIQHLQNECGKQKQRMCGYCKRRFKFEKNLLYHMKRECGKIDAYQCPKCQKQYLFRKNLNCHLKNDCAKRKELKCKMCNEQFVSRLSLNQHVRNVCGKIEPFSCLTCFKKYKYKSSLNAHMKYNCGRTKPHRCPQCQKLFSKKNTFDEHLRNSCVKEEPFKCSHCSKQFKYKFQLNAHVKNNCNPHKCSQCQRLFATESYLKSHMEHDCGRAEPLKCPQCPKLFATKSTLNQHIRDDCGRTEPHKCPQCLKLFSQKNSLCVHLKYICGKKKTFSCPTCFKNYKSKLSLNVHMKNDCGRTEPHKCPQCQKLFSKKNSLFVHMKYICGNKKPFSCLTCYKNYKSKLSLNVHMKNDCGNHTNALKARKRLSQKHL